MFTKTTIVLLGLFLVCEVCTLIVFCYQRTVRKLAMRLQIAQSKLVFCYPKWMLTMYKGTFLKFGIILALFIIEWRCALVSLGIFALFFFLSCVIIVPDGGNLIRIRREVKRCDRGTIGITTYQDLMTEIEKGIVATGGDLAKIDAEEQKQTEWGLPFKRQENFEWVDGKTKVKDKVRPQDVIVRTWENAPASIKGAIIAIGLVFGGMLLLVGVTTGEMTPLLALVLLLILLWLAFWIYQILRGKNWTRVFTIVLVLQVIVFSINNVSKGGAFDFSSTVGGASIALVIAALLFCPGANKWFVSWPRGWSYWPVLLIIPLVFNVINSSSVEENTDNFLIFVKTHKYEAAANLIDEIDVSNVGVQLSLGEMYLNGKGVPKNEVEAAKWFRKASEQGNPDAQYKLGWMRQNGRGVPRNDNEAAKWYGKATDQGHVVARNRLVAMRKQKKQDEQKKQEWHERLHYDFSAFSDDALKKIVDGEPCNLVAEKKNWYHMAVEQGDAAAQNNLGVVEMYNLVEGVEARNNPIEAIKWLRKAAEQGNATAQTNLGIMYQNGEGVVRDEGEAVKWYRKAAQQDNKDAQAILRKKGLTW